jgi:thioredoxin-related protein
MHTIRIVCLLLLFSQSLFCQVQEQYRINFVETSWKDAVAKAGREGKFIFLYAYTPSCHFCKQMEKEVFSEREVTEFYNANFINYKINIEDGADGEALSKEYGILEFPTYVYLNASANRVHQSGGAKSEKMFIADGKNAFDPKTAFFSLKDRYDSGEKSPELLYNYSNALRNYHSADSNEDKVVSEYLNTQSAADLESEKNLQFIFTRYLSYGAPSTQYFLKNQQKFFPFFSRSEIDHKAKRIITQTASLAGRQNNASLFQELKQIVRSDFKDTTQVLALAEIYFYGGKRDWKQYATATRDYSNNVKNETDWQTLHETAIYLKHFAEDTAVLTIGADLMEKVIHKNRSYEHLCLYAELQYKVGKKELALNSAKEALTLASQTNQDDNDAKELIAKIQN